MVFSHLDSNTPHLPVDDRIRAPPILYQPYVSATVEMNAPYPPPNRAQTLSPASINTNNTGSSEWSGMNNYESQNRSDSPYSPTQPFNRGDLVAPSEQGGQYGQPQRPMNGGHDVAPPSLSVGGQPRRPSDTPSRKSSPVNSIANSRSSDGTLSDVQSRKYRRMEMEVAQHYTVLRSYLRGGAPQPPRPNKARDKLLRLSPVQFHELSTDVFDELQRRQASAPLPGRPRRDQVPPFLQPRPDFHEKRNQARQKLSSLQTSRFRDLSTDVFCELERRFPHFQEMQQGQNRRQSPGGVPRGRGQGSTAGLPNGPASGGFVPPPRTHSAGISVSSQGGGRGGPRRGPNGSISVQQFDNPPGSADGEYGRPMPKQFQSNTMIPTKSTMVEDGDEDSGYQSRYDRSSDAFALENALSNTKSRDTTASSKSSASREARMAELQEKVEELNIALRLKDEEIRKHEESSKSTMNSDWIEIKQDLEQRLEDAENVERDLRSKLDKAQKSSSVDSTLKSNHDRLQQDHGALQQKLEQQRQVTEEVRQQAHAHLLEMRQMAETGGNLEREEKLQEDVHRLAEELNVWKARYTKTKTQLRNMKASSMGMSMAMARPDSSFEDHNGVVRDVNVTKFQVAVEELLHTARTEPSKVLDSMKSLVLAVRSITTDVDRAPQLDKEDIEFKRRTKLKARVSATANNVITASRNHAAAGGVSPVSLLDAAASHLSVAIVELVRAVKIRPSQAGELEDDDVQMVEGTGQEGYFDVGKSLRRQSQNGSLYSAISTPPAGANSHAESGPGPEVVDSYGGNENSGLGIKPGFGLRGEEEGDFEELKLYLEDQTDTLVASIQSLVASIRQEDVMPIVRSHIGAITDVVGNVISATEGVIEEAPHGSRLATTLERAVHQDIQKLENTRKQLVKASVDSQALDSARKGDGKVKMLTQGLPPLAFGIARDMKSLVANIEGVDLSGGDDFS